MICHAIHSGMPSLCDSRLIRDLRTTDFILIFGHHQSSISASPREFVVLYSPLAPFRGEGAGGPGGEGWDCYVQVSGSVICFGFQDNTEHRNNV